MNEINSKERVKFVEKRIKNAQYWILFFFAILIIYLIMLQLVDIRHYKVKAKNQRYSKTFVVDSTRTGFNKIDTIRIDSTK